ncbi:MAG: hypothetical protein H6R18_353 [Proteobacteria bacterium]|nr:hypothetical protein [Pseudomonadota bacterium]
MQRQLRSFSIILTIVLAFLVSGCVGTVKNMREVPADKASYVPESGKSVIVFMRPSSLGFAVQSSVFEIKDNKPELVGIVAAKTKLAYRVNPGKRLFMSIGENADFMAADIQPNKTYYVYVSPRMGMWKARFALEPKLKADLDKAEFKSDYDDCRWVETIPESSVWARDNMPSIESKRADYYPDWLKIPEAERPQLRAEDGR